MDPYEHITSLYDLEHDALEDDATFFVDLIGDGVVLEVGCGTGRILERLSRVGLETHGIDTSPSMLAAARKRLAGVSHVHLHNMSVETLDLPVMFQSCIWPLNVLWHLPDRKAQVHALRAVRSHLHPGGLLVLDLSNPLNMLDRCGGNEVRLRFQGEYKTGSVRAFSSAEDFEAEQVLELSLWYDRVDSDGIVRRTAAAVTLRYTYRFELEFMLEAAGFRVENVYGSYDLDSYASGSANLIVVGTAV